MDNQDNNRTSKDETENEKDLKRRLYPILLEERLFSPEQWNKISANEEHSEFINAYKRWQMATADSISSNRVDYIFIPEYQKFVELGDKTIQGARFLLKNGIKIDWMLQYAIIEIRDGVKARAETTFTGRWVSRTTPKP